MPPLLTRRPTGKVAAAMTLVLGGLAFSVGAPPASAEPLDGQAFGLSADITVSGEEVVTLPPTPAVDCPPDDSQEVVSLSDPDALPEPPGLTKLSTGFSVLDSGILTAECSTMERVLTATASVEDLNLFDGVLTASALEAECTANGDPTGDANVAELMVAVVDMDDEPIAIEVTGEPNQEVEIPDAGTITINRQTVTENPDGTTTITVDALVVDLDVAQPVTGDSVFTVDLIASSVSCTSSLAVAPPSATTTVPTTATTAPATTSGQAPVAETPPATPVVDNADFTG